MNSTNTNPNNTPKISPIKQLFNKVNKLFNDADSAAEAGLTKFPPDEPIIDVGIRDNEIDVYDGLMRAMSQAIDKKAKKDVATLYRFNHTRWVLTHVEIFVKSSFKDRQITLKRLASKTLKNLFLSSLKKSPVADMYNITDFSGVTLTLESEANTEEFLQVLAVYEDDNVAYHFAFDGEIDQGEDVVEPKEEAANPAPVLRPVQSNVISKDTPLSGDLKITLSSAGASAFWPAGWGHPYANAEQVGVYDLPLVIGRTQQAANQGSGAGFGVQAMPASIATDKASFFLPIYGCEQVSSEHAVISQNEAGELCITDYSSNGTWLGGKRLVLGVATPLPSTGELGLCAPSALRGSKPSVQLQFALAGVQAAQAQAAPLQTPAPAVQAVPIAESAAPIYAFKAQGTQFDAACNASKASAKTAAKPTDLNIDHNAQHNVKTPSAIAQLLVRTMDGHVETHAITHWPLTIGRESTCDIVLPEACCKTSREHLRLERPLERSTQAGKTSLRGFHVTNLALEKNGTYNKGQREDATFVLQAHNGGGRDGSASQDGWITLGQAQLSDASVQLKLEALA